MKKSYNLPCNIAETLNIVGDRWTLLIVRNLLTGISKFSELRDSLPGLAPNILSDRLQLLEEKEIVKQVPYSNHPPRFEYRLTDKGKDLKHILNMLAIWGNKYLDVKYYEVVDAQCGHEVDFGYYCPTCDRNVTSIQYKQLSEE